MAKNNDDKGIATPHDRLFHSVFEQSSQAAAYLQKALPTQLAARIDWSTLEPMPQTVVDRTLGKGRMDLVYTAEMRGRTAEPPGRTADTAEPLGRTAGAEERRGRPTILHVLWEHQSSADHWQALRCARYVLLWWDWWLGQHKDAKTLPLVLPLVLYHGRQPWTVPTRLRDLIDVDCADDLEGTGIVLPDFTYLVDDLTQRSDPEIVALWQAGQARLVIQLFKHVFTPDFRQWVTDLLTEVPTWLRLPDQLQILEPVLLYVLQVAENLTAADLRRIERAWGPHAEGFVMTLAEQLRQEGLEEGARNMAAQAVLDVFDARKMDVPAEVRDRILACTNTQTLSEWLRRAVLAASAAEIFDV